MRKLALFKMWGYSAQDMLCLLYTSSKSNEEILKMMRDNNGIFNKGKNADSSNIPLCAIIGLVYGLKHKEKRFTLFFCIGLVIGLDRKSTRLNSSHSRASRMPSSA